LVITARLETNAREGALAKLRELTGATTWSDTASPIPHGSSSREPIDQKAR
jgi:hypothetical protein